MVSLQVFAVKYALDQPGVGPDPICIDHADTVDEAQAQGAKHFGVEAEYVRAWEGQGRRGERCFYVECPSRQDEGYDYGPAAFSKL